MTIPFNHAHNGFPSNKTKQSVTKTNNIFLIGIAFLLLYGPIRDLINVLSLMLFGSYNQVISSILQVITMVVFACSLIIVFLKKYKFLITTFVIFALVWTLSYYCNKDAQPYILNGISLFFFECLPFLWVFYYIFSQKNEFITYEFIKSFFKVNNIKLLIVIISQSFMFIFPQCDIYRDYMSASYTLLNPLILVLASYFCGDKRIRNIVSALIASLYIIILGCRGALVCELFFLTGFFVFFVKKNKSFYRVSLIFIALLMLLLIQPLADVLVIFGLNSRSIEGIRNFQFFKDENRSIIFEIISLKTFQNPFGLGVMADRPILLSSSQLWQIFYSHNLFLELGIDFGVFGYLLFVIFIMLVVNAIKKGSYIMKIVVWSLFCMSVVKLMYSSTLWADQYLWALLGSAYAIVNNKRRKSTCQNLA